MLFIHTNNQLERLSQLFTSVINTPLSNVFAPEMVVVQNAGMARYLSMQVATMAGISANTDYLFPAEFMWRLLRLVSPDIPEKSQCTPETLRFHIMQELSENDSDYPELEHYISKEGSADESATWELACQLADTLDKILFYRSDWVEMWEKFPEKHSSNWQARLWIRCITDKKLKHWLMLQQQFKHAINQIDKTLLPERISFFSMSSLSPGYLELIGEIAKLIDIHIYVINPCEDIYWGDITSEKTRAKLTIEKQAYVDIGNPLLASMGIQGRDFIDQLLSLSESSEDIEHNPVPLDNTASTPNTLLSKLQQDIFTLSAPKKISVLDNSIHINACHTTMREVEVLHDQILDALDSDSTLTPADIVVMMPDVEKYAPYIESIFSSEQSDNNVYLPFSIADRDPLNVHQLIDALLKALSLSDTYFDVESVFEVLDYEAVYRSFNLDEDQLTQCRKLARATNIRWGINAKSRKRNNLPNTDEHTWKYALDKTLLGYALGETAKDDVSEVLFENKASNTGLGLLPFHEIEGNNALMLAQFNHFTHIIFKTNEWNNQTLFLEDWLEKITVFCKQLFSNDQFAIDLAVILKSINELRELLDFTEFKTKVSFPLFQTLLKTSLQKITGHEKFLGHGITFCALVPMRSVPFKLVALMGMNDGEFPRQDKQYSFDEVAKQPKRGDRSRRDEDRYLFLESILAARNRLIISYIGQSIKDNTTLPPSVLVNELIDSLCIYTGEEPEALICKHPLQAFSPRYFQDEHSKNKHARLFSYANQYIALKHQEKQEISDFINKPLAELDDHFKVVSLDDLIRFYQNPAQTFLKKRFDIQTYGNDIVLPIREPFQLESFKDRDIRTLVAKAELNNETSIAHTQKIARAEGLLPYGDIGETLFNKEKVITEEFLEEYPSVKTLDPSIFSLSLGEFNLHGSITQLIDKNTRNIHKLSAIYSNDMVALWLTHLVLNTQQEATTHFVSPELGFIIKPVNDAKEQLENLLKNYWQGLHFPLQFFPKSSYAMFKETGTEKTPKAISAWNGSERFKGEKDKFENWLLFRNLSLSNDMKDKDSKAHGFYQLSHEFFGKMYQEIILE